MRVSTDREDRGYLADTVGMRVFLDGIELEEVVTADEETGEVVQYLRDVSGHLLIDDDTGEAARHILRGRVRIEVCSHG